jgi:asparagine synthase (glutamine-hydrolysing)
VVGLMSKLMSEPVKTFSIGFEEKAYDELDYARVVAQHFKTDHHEYVVKPDALEILPKLIWHYDEPFADSSSVPSYYVSKITRQEVTVALNGDGGDENFAGYPRYKAIKLAEQYGKLPRWMRENVIDNIVKRIPYSPERKSSVRQFRKLMDGMNYPREQRHARWICIFDNETKNALYTSSFKETLRGIDSVDYLIDYHRNSGCKNFLDSALFVDIMTYLPGDLLVKIDIATMANSLETRSPFLDHKFMEFAAGIPSNLKVKGLNTSKYILKKAFSDFVPQSILHRRKMGFAVPMSRWFRNELKEYAHDILLSRRSLERGYFREESLKSILDEHCDMHFDHGDRLWALLNFELWQRMFIDRIPDGNV